MANICEYKVIVKGKKNSCYAFFGSMSCYDKWVEDESGTDFSYILRFEGSCAWSVDSDCEPWNGDIPVELPKDANEAETLAEDEYYYKTVQDRSKMFEVEVWCNSYSEGDYYATFEHYINGEKIDDKCPLDILFDDVMNESVEAPIETNRVKAYYDSNDEFKCFSCKYQNPILENILIKYNYSSEILEDPTDIGFLEERIPDYNGVQTIEELTSTLISALISFGKADEGLEKELINRKVEIQKAFISIEGTSQETMDSEKGEYFLVDGFDFEMTNGKYSSSYRQCDGGW